MKILTLLSSLIIFILLTVHFGISGSIFVIPIGIITIGLAFIQLKLL